MIPKILHYIWLGGNPLPEKVVACMETWKKYCPEYEIKRWDESNLNLDMCKYARQAYDAKKYAFASDFFRFYVLKEFGGIYLDVDVELLKSLDDLLDQKCFMGFECYGKQKSVNPGLIAGSEKNGKVVTDMYNNYLKDNFLFKDGTINYETVCTKTTNYLIENYQLEINDEVQNLKDVTIYPSEYFCPINGETKVEEFLTENTYSRHIYLASWLPPMTTKTKIKNFIKKVIIALIGKKNFEKIREKRRKRNGN